jgi:ABC-type uncharacterized transport system permease subunit
MDRSFLLLATLLTAVGGVLGMLSVHRGRRSHWTVILLSSAFLCQIGFLSVRGQVRAACPLTDTGEILAFLAWALTLFYLLIGPAYRISLLGVFTAPLVFIFQTLALLPGVMTQHPQRIAAGNPWYETHSAMSVLSYGAFALAAVAGIMFLVLDRQLKEQHLKSGLFRNLPPVRDLLISLIRLLWLGSGLLTIGVAAGFLMPSQPSAWAHLAAALAVWSCYIALIIIHRVRGLTGRRLSLLTVIFFLTSLLVFAFV